MSIRKFTIYLRDNGLNLIKVLFNKQQLTFEDSFDWFKVPQNGKKIYVERMIERLLNAGIIEYEELNKVYHLSQNATDKVVKLNSLIHLDLGHSSNPILDRSSFNPLFTKNSSPPRLYSNLRSV